MCLPLFNKRSCTCYVASIIKSSFSYILLLLSLCFYYFYGSNSFLVKSSESMTFESFESTEPFEEPSLSPPLLSAASLQTSFGISSKETMLLLLLLLFSPPDVVVVPAATTFAVVFVPTESFSDSGSSCTGIDCFSISRSFCFGASSFNLFVSLFRRRSSSTLCCIARSRNPRTYLRKLRRKWQTCRSRCSLNSLNPPPIERFSPRFSIRTALGDCFHHLLRGFKAASTGAVHFSKRRGDVTRTDRRRH